MPEDSEVLKSGQYMLAVQGFAMIRWCTAQPSKSLARVNELRTILEHYDEFPHSLEFPVNAYGVEAGYSQWAPVYDGPNPAIAREEPIVREMLEGIAPGDALDAACGTGRHAALLASLGHRVIGVDATEAMLRVAREKAPSAALCRGVLDALPVPDASVDVVTCALALEHVRDLGPVFAEFARVLRPGGRAIVSDMHPVTKMTGGVAAFPAQDGSRGVRYVTGHVHQMSDYTRAFLSAGFRLEACVEPVVDEATLAMFPSSVPYPEATRQAFLGLPFVLIWLLSR